jgi:hypothetical protein
VRAQGPTIRAARIALPNCARELCEITYQEGLFGGHIEIGDARERHGVGFTGAPLADAVRAVPDAYDEAQRGRGFHTAATVIRAAALVGTVVVLTSRSVTHSPEPGIARVVIFTLAPIAFFIFPLVPQDIANTHYHRAVELYDLELPR